MHIISPAKYASPAEHMPSMANVATAPQSTLDKMHALSSGHFDLGLHGIVSLEDNVDYGGVYDIAHDIEISNPGSVVTVLNGSELQDGIDPEDFCPEQADVLCAIIFDVIDSNHDGEYEQASSGKIQIYGLTDGKGINLEKFLNAFTGNTPITSEERDWLMSDLVSRTKGWVFPITNSFGEKTSSSDEGDLLLELNFTDLKLELATKDGRVFSKSVLEINNLLSSSVETVNTQQYERHLEEELQKAENAAQRKKILGILGRIVAPAGVILAALALTLRNKGKKEEIHNGRPLYTGKKDFTEIELRERTASAIYSLTGYHLHTDALSSIELPQLESLTDAEANGIAFEIASNFIYDNKLPSRMS
jgi:hypothetical protein